MHVERLEQLRRVVEAAPDDRLHMRTWCEEAECGTAYCAAGWAAIDPWFRKNTNIGEIFDIDAAGVVAPVDDAGPRAVHALAILFDLAHADACRLFGAELGKRYGPHAVAKEEVLANIDRLLHRESAKKYHCQG